MSNVYGLDYFDQPSNPSISSSSAFSGTVKFEISKQNEYRILPMNTSILVGLKIVMNNELNQPTPLRPIVNSGTRDAPTAISVPYLAPNPVSTLFKRAQCMCNGTSIGYFDDIAQTNTLYRYIVESKSEDDVSNSTNCIKPMNSDDIDVKGYSTLNNWKSLADDVGVVGAGPLAAFKDLFTNRMIWALKNHQYNFNKSQENILTMQVPLPLFLQKNPIYIGSPMVLNFVINADWLTDLIQIAGSPYIRLGGAAADSAYTVTNKSSAFDINTINVSITSLNLRLCRIYQNSIPQSIQYQMKQYSISTYQINSSQLTIPFSSAADRRVSHIIVGFVNYRNKAFKNTITDFSPGFSVLDKDVHPGNKTETFITNDATTLLKSLSVTFAGYIYPNSPYELTHNVNTSTNHWGTAYSDYVNNCVNLDRCAPLLTFQQFIINPIFTFKTKQHVSNLGGSGNINVSFTQSPADGSTAYILCLYDEFMTCYFNKNGELDGDILLSAGTTV